MSFESVREINIVILIIFCLRDFCTFFFLNKSYNVFPGFGYKTTLGVLALLTFTGIGLGLLYRPLTASNASDEEAQEKEMVTGYCLQNF